MYTMTKQKLNYFNPFSQKPSLSPISCVYSCPGRKLAHLKRLGALFLLLITFFVICLLMCEVTFCRRSTCMLGVLILLDVEKIQNKGLETYFTPTNLERTQSGIKKKKLSVKNEGEQNVL